MSVLCNFSTHFVNHIQILLHGFEFCNYKCDVNANDATFNYWVWNYFCLSMCVKFVCVIKKLNESNAVNIYKNNIYAINFPV